MVKITHAYHVMIDYYKTDGLPHLLAREDEQCCRNLSENYEK